MDKHKYNWWIDAVLLAAFWIAFFPEVTGLEGHQWLGIAAACLAAWHLVLHWKWVETVTLRFFSRVSAAARIHYCLDLGVMLGFFMIFMTGLLISTWLDLPLYDLAAWTQVHTLASVFTLVLVVVKLILHWRWLVVSIKRLFPGPAHGWAGSNPAAAAVTVGRRDFLKISGILCAATAATIHGLVEDAVEARAQSLQSEFPQAETGTPAAAVPSAVTNAILTAAPAVPASTPETCTVRCPNGCSFPGRCRRYVDRNGNKLCDNGECL